MTQKKAFLGAAAAGAMALFPFGAAQAEVKLHRLLSDGMVLQRRISPRIWGTATPGEKVTVSMAGKRATATADSGGNWEARLPALEAGGPHILTVEGANRLEVRDVMVGEVWVCSGQSNMEWNLASLRDAQPEIASANDPGLRMFTVPHRPATEPQSDLAGGTWRPAVPQYVGGFSAVAYYFGKYLRKELGVPVGLIHTSWGGTRIEAWSSKPVNLANGIPQAEYAALATDSPQFREQMKQYQAQVDRWKAAGSPEGTYTDPGITAVAAGWEKPELQDSGWQTVKLPVLWENAGKEALAGIDGGVWFRREFTLPAEISSPGSDAELTLTLGPIDDFDQTFINGVKVGQTGAETPNFWAHPRQYKLPAGVLKPGKNTIAIRVWDHTGDGGFSGNPDTMAIGTAKETLVSLAGDWKFKIEVARPQAPGAPPNASNPNAASVLYYGMLQPLVKYPIKGAIWYQGESNAGNGMRYRKQLPDMIANWRQDWGVGNFPFLVAQLAPFTDIRPEPGESGWATLREAQFLATKALPAVGLAVITDSGEEKDIHPQRKQPVGERLALQALKLAYGRNVVASGPVFQKMEVKNGKAILTFDTQGKLAAAATDSGGRPVPEGKLTGFAIAGADGKFVWADAVISGRNTVTVSSPGVPEPKAVRFGWADFPVVNLWNADARTGERLLPAVPFRTDMP